MALYFKNLSSIPSYLPHIITNSSNVTNLLTTSVFTVWPPGDKKIIYELAKIKLPKLVGLSLNELSLKLKTNQDITG